MTAVFHRLSRANMPIAVRGDGCYIIDKDGKAIWMLVAAQPCLT